MEIKVRNVNEAFSKVFWLLKVHNYPVEQTRNGPAIAFPEPVITSYSRPTERVLFNTERDANPIFHLMESIWMLAGRQDVAFLERFNSKIEQYSDNSVTFNAAYGHRWRTHFGLDQLWSVVELLRHDPQTRQAVIQMWDPADLNKKTKDKACNTQLVFDCRGEVLNMSVFNRSNDIWWGAYGANAVHFSMLQEFVASSVGIPVGTYHQISSNFHLYTELYPATHFINSPPVEHDPYQAGIVYPRPLLSEYRSEMFLLDCADFCRSPFAEIKYHNTFFREVAHPMAMVAFERRNKRSDGYVWANLIEADDWRKATVEWIERRELALARA